MIAQEKGRWDWGTFGLLTPVKILRLAFAIFFTLLLLLLREYVDLRGCSHGLRRYARWRLFSFRSVCGPPLLLCTAVAFSFVDVLHTVLFSHILYTYLLILHSTRKVSLRGHRGSCRGCWRKSRRRRRRRRSHSWYWWWWWWSLLEMLKAAQQLQSIQEVPAAHF